MKNIKGFILIIFMIFTYNIKVNAAIASISTSSSTVDSGSSFTVTTKFSAAAWHVNVNFSGPVSCTTTSDLEKTSTGFSDALISTKKTDTDVIWTFSCKATGAGTITIRLTGDVTNQVGTSGEGLTSDVSALRVVNSIVRSSNNKLSSLSIDGVSLSPAFNATTYNYNVSTTLSSVNIKATVQDAKSTISGTGNKALKYGDNKFSITVTAENGKQQVYTININRKDTRSSDSTLKSMTTSYGNLGFSPSKTSYTVNLPKDISEYKIAVSTNNDKATYKISPSNSITLKDGESKTIYIDVVAENGSKTQYKISVVRGDSRSNNNYLSSLSLSVGKLDFNKDVVDYNVIVPKETVGVKVSYTTADPKAKVSISGNPNELVDGMNTITVSVTAQNGSVRKYILKINRIGNGLVVGPTVTTVPTTTTTTEPVTEPASIGENNSKEENTTDNPNGVLMLFIGIAIGIGLGLGGEYLVKFIITKKYDNFTDTGELEVLDLSEDMPKLKE